MHKKDRSKTTEQRDNPETIIRQHRRWAYWVEPRRILGEGSLILTNYRLLFLHRIEASPEVSASIKKLADAPVKTVLNHALTLHKSSFEIPLPSIIQADIGAFFGFPLPRYYLSVLYLEGENLTPCTVAFQFRGSGRWLFSQPQLIIDWSWKHTIQRTIRVTAQPG